MCWNLISSRPDSSSAPLVDEWQRLWPTNISTNFHRVKVIRRICFRTLNFEKLAVKDNPYRDELEGLLKKVRPRLSSTHDLAFKKCFGAVAGYVNGNIFISCGRFGVALKLPPKTLATLFEDEEVKPLKYFPNGHIKKEYAVLPKNILDDSKKLKKLIDKSIDEVCSD